MKTRFPILSMLLLGFSINAVAQDWPQFLGPNRNGHSNETALIDGWPEHGPREVWKAPSEVGMSGLAISGGRLLTMVQTDGKQSVICLDAKTGEPIWKTPVAEEYKNGQGDGPRATPAISRGKVLVYTGEGILVALQYTDGKVLWSHDVVSDHAGKAADYGMACSPLVVGDHVVVIAGAAGATLVAYEIETGNVAWKAGESDSAGYSSPVVLYVGGRKQIVAHTGGAVLGLAADNGMLLWRYPYQTDYDCNIATPVAYQGRVFISSGENHGCALLKLDPVGEKFQPTEVWSSQGKASVMRNEWQTSILIGDYLYGFDNVGSAGPVTHLACVNAATGIRAWQKLRFGKGNLIAADGKLMISTMKGELVLAKATPDGYQELARASVIGSTRQAPVLANGLLYLRDQQEIICLNMRK